MGYGGPRIEFYTQNQYSNFTSSIQREDAARVRDILRRRQVPTEADLFKERQEKFRAQERAAAAEAAYLRTVEEEAVEKRRIHDEEQIRCTAKKVKRRSLTDAEKTLMRSRRAHLTQLAAPKKYTEPLYGSGMYGMCMHQQGHTVVYPTGRNGAVYCPGVDRDRIIPVPKEKIDTLPPWIGSYSDHHGTRELKEKADARADSKYYINGPRRHGDAEEEAIRQATLDRIAAAHAPASLSNESPPSSSPAKAEATTVDHFDFDVDDDGESIFSHGSSNGPIAATGNPHLMTLSTKDSVSLHLTRYGGAMTAPRAKKPEGRPTLSELTLPQLRSRLFQIEVPTTKTV